MALRVEEVAGSGAFAALRDEWRALHDRSRACPFLSWEWASTWHRHLGADRLPRIFCVYRGDELVGLLPLAEERVAVARRLSFLGERWGGADYLDVLAAEGESFEVARALVGHLAERGAFDVLDLDGLAADSTTLGVLSSAFGEDGNFRIAVAPRFTCPQVELPGTWDEVLRGIRRASNVKRRLKQALGDPSFEWRVIREPAEALPAFERFLALHEARWSVQGGSDAMGRPAIQDFHREVVVRLAEAGRLRFEEVWLDGACRASIYGIDAGPTYCFYQSGYDPAWAKSSLGMVCLALSIRDAVERGVRRYDFLRGTESYKFDWSNGTRETVAVRVAAQGIPSALLAAREGAEAAARAAAHAVLPSVAVDLLRRLRRARERQSVQGGTRRDGRMG